MADQLPLAFQTEFDAMVSVAFQNHAVLMGTMYEKRNITGKYCQFRRRSKGAAVPHVRNSPITPLNLGLTVATCELTDWDASERLDPMDLIKINWDDQKVVAESLGLAIGRRADQLRIDAMAAASPQQIAVDYESPGTSTALSVKKINHARALLLKNGVPDGPGSWHAAISALALEGALNDTKIGSQDYNVLRSLYEGALKEYSGFTFHVIGDRDEGGLPTTALGYRKCYFWDTNSIGYAEAMSEGMDGRVRIDWSPDYQGWLLCAKLSAGSKVIEAEGIVEVLVDESKAAA